MIIYKCTIKTKMLLLNLILFTYILFYLLYNKQIKTKTQKSILETNQKLNYLCMHFNVFNKIYNYILFYYILRYLTVCKLLQVFEVAC